MRLGAQLYTVRDFIKTEKDIRDSLEIVAKMGYKTVQVSAMGPIDPKKLYDICSTLGLSVVLTHTAPDRILYDTDKVIEEHKIMGCKYIGLGSMPEKYRNPVWPSHFKEDFREPAKKRAESGMYLMYHNHAFEFEKFGGKRIIETILEDFSAEEMGITLDTYWVQYAGADIFEWLEILKDRMPCVHLKDMWVRNGQPEMAPVLEGNINFREILGRLEKNGKTEYLLIEQDTCVGSPFDCLKPSYDNLTALGYK